MWWTGKCIQGILAVFFLIFGIQLCRASYELTNPFYFLITFFASNLIILISGAILAGFLNHVYLRLKKKVE
ncbi:MAG TPA: hypothetical protein ENG51_00375 [Deltaproteobacteria bacterium]|nr:MAG: hypothetical protein DRG83_00595 [Deltaproteobacteria bacterium]HDM74909.1 hypothetical protein [Deltaproteobacteria bacterium]